MTKNLAIYRRRGWVEVERRTEHGLDRVYLERSVDAEDGSWLEAAKVAIENDA